MTYFTLQGLERDSHGVSFYCWTEEYLTAEHGIRFLDALTNEFGEELAVILDRGSYFYAKDLWEFVSDERSTECVEDTSVERVCGSPLQVWYFPPRLPKLNPVEGCWNQLNEWFKHRLITDIDELKESLLIGFEEITEPDIYQYLCP